MEGNETNAFVVTIDGLTVTLLVSSILYAFCLVLVKRRISSWESSTEFNLKKLLVLSVGLVCIIRIMSFFGVAAMNLANISTEYTIKPVDTSGSDNGDTADTEEEDRDQDFYDGAMTVLFDLPNCIVVSTYVLLTIVWAECFLYSRHHTENTVKWRKFWLGSYMLFNACLYATQIILYILIFWPGPSSDRTNIVRTILYVAMTGINFIAVLLVFLLYLYLNMKFSGFPFRSPQAEQSLSQITSLMIFWSVARLLWGFAMLFIYIWNIELLQSTTESGKANYSFVLLLFLFVICEIIPILTMLDYSYLTIIHFESKANNTNNSALPMSHREGGGGGVGGVASRSGLGEPLLTNNPKRASSSGRSSGQNSIMATWEERTSSLLFGIFQNNSSSSGSL